MQAILVCYVVFITLGDIGIAQSPTGFNGHVFLLIPPRIWPTKLCFVQCYCCCNAAAFNQKTDWKTMGRLNDSAGSTCAFRFQFNGHQHHRLSLRLPVGPDPLLNLVQWSQVSKVSGASVGRYSVTWCLFRDDDIRSLPGKGVSAPSLILAPPTQMVRGEQSFRCVSGTYNLPIWEIYPRSFIAFLLRLLIIRHYCLFITFLWTCLCRNAICVRRHMGCDLDWFSMTIRLFAGSVAILLESQS